MYFLINGIDTDYTWSQSNSLLIRESIRIAHNLGKKFDFEGSVLQPIEHIFRGFGAVQKCILESINLLIKKWIRVKLAPGLKTQKFFNMEEMKMSMKETLLSKIDNREIVVGVVGLGYVGLPLAVEKAKAGFKTIGFDVQSQKVKMVNDGHNYIGDVVDSDLNNLVKAGKLQATTDFSFVKDVDFIAICVPTPLNAHQEPDISFVKSSAEEISKYLKPNTMVVLESTTYPGTTEELIKPILEEGSGLKCGSDFYLGFSPERVDPGNLVYKTKNTPKVVGAIGEDATEVIAKCTVQYWRERFILFHLRQLLRWKNFREYI